MDTLHAETLVEKAKIRFNHTQTKIVLTEKYDSKLLVASQNGLWKADMQTISFLYSQQHKTTLIMLDTFGNVLHVNRQALLDTLNSTYTDVMAKWHNEFSRL